MTLKPIPDYGDLIPIDEFRECVEEGGFTDYDGNGYYATEDGVSDIIVNLQELVAQSKGIGGFNHGDSRWTHVMWFNK